MPTIAEREANGLGILSFEGPQNLFRSRERDPREHGVTDIFGKK